MPIDRDQRRFVALGKRLYGDEGWQREFARLTGLSHQLVSKIAAGDRAVTDVVRAKVINGLRVEVERMRDRAISVLELLREYEK